MFWNRRRNLEETNTAADEDLRRKSKMMRAVQKQVNDELDVLDALLRKTTNRKRPHDG